MLSPIGQLILSSLIVLLLVLGLDVVLRGGILIRFLLPRNGAFQCVPHPAHENGAEEILEGDERVVNAQQDRREAEIDEEDHQSEVDDSMRGLDESLLLQYEDNGGGQAALRYAGSKKNIWYVEQENR